MIKNRKGFTLLELLVVIGIIGILVALGTVAYSSTQRSGRDSRRKQDMVAIQSAMEQYYSENTFSYPTPPNLCTVAATYLKSGWPVDPDNSGSYIYSESCPDGTSYCICALMEKNTSGNSGANCAWSNGKTHYCVGNLQ